VLIWFLLGALVLQEIIGSDFPPHHIGSDHPNELTILQEFRINSVRYFVVYGINVGSAAVYFFTPLLAYIYYYRRLILKGACR